MNWCLKLLIVGVGGLLMEFPTRVFNLPNSVQHPQIGHFSPALAAQLPERQIDEIARAITVRILLPQGGGSGILIHRQGQIYTVLTNAHVLEQALDKPFRLQTRDGQIYSSRWVGLRRHNGYDLGLISFRSSRNYTIAALAPPRLPRPGEEVFAAGFPYDGEFSRSQGFTLTKGQIQQLSEQSFAGGYQIGYTNSIEKGMSGGPLLNLQGQVVGINGIHSHPLWGNPYIFADGSVASKARREQMSRLSWAIPIQTFLQLEPKFLPRAAEASPLSPSPSSRPRPPAANSKPRLW